MPENDEVGYCKPPRNNQFRKGQSGNPQGRPKGTRNFASVFHDVIGRKVEVKENGQTRTMTMLEAILLQLINKAAAGDLKATKEAIQLLRLHDIEASREEILEGPDKEKDQAIMQRLMRRFETAAKAQEQDEEEPNGNVIP